MTFSLNNTFEALAGILGIAAFTLLFGWLGFLFAAGIFFLLLAEFRAKDSTFTLAGKWKANKERQRQEQEIDRIEADLRRTYGLPVPTADQEKVKKAWARITKAAS